MYKSISNMVELFKRTITIPKFTVNNLKSCNLSRNCYNMHCSKMHKAIDCIGFHGSWTTNERQKFIEDMHVINDFLLEDQEAKLLEEVEPYLKRLRYEFDHWDNAIQGFRETERKHWYPHNRIVINRISQVAFNGKIMPYVHVLDLAENGVIKPHVDSTRYCGNTIAGVSLLSDCVMRLVRTDERKYQQNQNTEDNFRNLPEETNPHESTFYADVYLKRRSLYIMTNSARYNFTHEILGNDNSKFGGRCVRKARRISIVCRNDPQCSMNSADGILKS